jgi:hypothetical protein
MKKNTHLLVDEAGSIPIMSIAMQEHSENINGLSSASFIENQCHECKEIKKDEEFYIFPDTNEKTLCLKCADKINNWSE